MDKTLKVRPSIKHNSFSARRTMRTHRVVFTIVIFVISLCTNSGKATEPIKIGFVGPLAGPLGLLGHHSLTGAQISVEEINSQGGVLGKPLKLVSLDDACQPDQTRTQFEHLINKHNVIAIVGPFCTESSLEIKEISKRNEVAVFSGTRLETDLIKQLGDSFFSRTYHIQSWAPVLAKLALAKGAKKIELIASNNSYGKTALSSLVNEIPKGALQSRLVPFDDFTTRVRDLKAWKPVHDAIFFAAPQPVDIASLKWAKSAKFLQAILSFCPDPVWFDKAGKLAEGVIFAASYPFNRGEVSSFVQTFQKSVGRNPFFYPQNSYDIIRVISTAIENAGSANPRRFRKVLTDLRIMGMSGPIEINNNVIRGVFYPAQVVNNRVIALEGTHGDGGGSP